jgi:hypothetical protein
MFSIKSTAKSDTRKLDGMFNRLRSLDKYEVAYGYFEGDVHDDSGLDIAHLAEMLNYGTDNIPARPFMDLAGDMVERHFEIDNQWKRDIWRYLGGLGQIKTILAQFGRVGETYVQASIDVGDWEDNVEWWKQAKLIKYGSSASAPLIASQDLYNSVEVKVVKIGDKT